MPPNTSQTKKRKLGDTGDSPRTAERAYAKLVRDEHVWYEDGNIIVCVQSAKAGPVYGFRCHSAVLAARSPVFDDMFKLPHTSGNRVDGAELFDLPDSLEDVRGLLWYLYGHSDILPLSTARHPDLLAVIGGPLRLAAKYQMDEVVKKLLPVFERDWPSSYKDWKRGEVEFRMRHADDDEDAVISRELYQDPAAAIHLAHQLSVRSVLPAAYYELSRILLRKPSEGDPEPEDRWADARLLTRADLEHLQVGREAIARHIERVFTPAVREMIPALKTHADWNATSSPDECRHILREWWRQECSPLSAKWYKDPIGRMHATARILDSGAGDPEDESLVEACGECRHELSEFMRQEAQTLWDKLPVFFDLHALQT